MNTHRPKASQNIVISPVVMADYLFLTPAQKFPRGEVCRIVPENRGLMERAARQLQLDVTFVPVEDKLLVRGHAGCDYTELVERFKALQLKGYRRPRVVATPPTAPRPSLNAYLMQTGYFKQSAVEVCTRCHHNPKADDSNWCEACTQQVARNRVKQKEWKRRHKVQCKEPGCPTLICTPSKRDRSSFTGYCRQHFGKARTQRLKAEHSEVK